MCFTKSVIYLTGTPVAGMFHQTAILIGAVLMEGKLNVDRVIFASLSALQRTSAVI